jgi:hypothetical protein
MDSVNMNKLEIAPGIIVYDDVIPDSQNLHTDIEEALDMLSLDWSPALVLTESQDYINTDSRDTSTFGISYFGKIENISGDGISHLQKTLNNLFFENFNPLEEDYKQYFGIETVSHDSYGILKYGVGQKFGNHIDDHNKYHRRVSTIYYLNDDYTGGEINFPRFNITFKPKANQMIIFPSTYVYNHSVSPVTSGTRYAVVSWMK